MYITHAYAQIPGTGSLTRHGLSTQGTVYVTPGQCKLGCLCWDWYASSCLFAIHLATEVKIGFLIAHTSAQRVHLLSIGDVSAMQDSKLPSN